MNELTPQDLSTDELASLRKDVEISRLVEDFESVSGTRRFTVLTGGRRGKGQRARLARMLQENERVLINAPQSHTSPTQFRLKPLVLAVNQALMFYSAWNWMNAEKFKQSTVAAGG